MIDFNLLIDEYKDFTGFAFSNEEGEAVGYHRENPNPDAVPFDPNRANKVQKPIQGLFHFNPISISPIRNPFIGVLTANVKVLAPVERWEEARDVMNSFAIAKNGATAEMSDVGDPDLTYTVAYSCQTASTGERILDASFGNGEVMRIDQLITYTIIESGASAFGFDLRIDGIRVPVLSAVERKIHTPTMHSTASGEGVTLSDQEAYSLQFTTPMGKSEFSELLCRNIDELTGNKAHDVYIRRTPHDKPKNRMMIFMETSDSIAPPNNIGLNVTLAEASPKAAVFDGSWETVKASGRIATVSSITAQTDGTPTKAVIYWGDGATDTRHITHDMGEREWAIEPIVHAYKDGKESHLIYVKLDYPNRYFHGMEQKIASTLFGCTMHFDGIKTPSGRIYAGDFGLDEVRHFGDGKESAVISLNGNFYQKIANKADKTFVLYQFGKTDASGGSYIENGMEVNLLLDGINLPSIQDGKIYDYIYFGRKEIERWL